MRRISRRKKGARKPDEEAMFRRARKAFGEPARPRGKGFPKFKPHKKTVAVNAEQRLKKTKKLIADEKIVAHDILKMIRRNNYLAVDDICIPVSRKHQNSNLRIGPLGVTLGSVKRIYYALIDMRLIRMAKKKELA